MLFSQQIDQQIEFKVANDKFVLVDKYYTSGIFFTYKKKLKTSFIFKKDSTSVLQHSFTLGNQTYTPTNLSSTNVADFDRPFAGWLFINYNQQKIKKHSVSSLNFQTGITGEESLSGKLQIWFHNFLGIDDFISWTDEIAFKWLFNINYQYIYNWPLSKKKCISIRTEHRLRNQRYLCRK